MTAMSTLPPALQALAVLAHAHRIQGDPARSALLLAAIAHLHPHDAAVLRNLAAAELAAGRPQQALSALEALTLAGERGSEDRGEDGAFHLLRAQALLALDRSDEARSAMQAAIQGMTALRRGAPT